MAAVMEPGEAGGEREVAVVLDLLWRKLQGIHEQEVTRTAARLSRASLETRAAAEALSIAILRAVFSCCTAVLLESDTGRAHSAHMLGELFDLPRR